MFNRITPARRQAYADLVRSPAAADLEPHTRDEHTDLVTSELELSQHGVEHQQLAADLDQLLVNPEVAVARQRVLDQVRVVRALTQHRHHVAQLHVLL